MSYSLVSTKAVEFTAMHHIVNWGLCFKGEVLILMDHFEDNGTLRLFSEYMENGDSLFVLVIRRS